MSATICGHERVVLTRVLRNRFDATMTRFSSLDEERADDDCHDPAKLAEMLIEEGRRLSVTDVIVRRLDTNDPSGNGTAGIVIVWGRFPERMRIGWADSELPQARALLRKWIQLPDGAREEAERALSGHADPDELLNTIPLREYPTPRQFDADPDREREP
jgi:hypothetical protein